MRTSRATGPRGAATTVGLVIALVFGTTSCAASRPQVAPTPVGVVTWDRPELSRTSDTRLTVRAHVEHAFADIPCADHLLRPRVVESDRAVTITLRAFVVPAPPGTACSASRRVFLEQTIVLARPLSDRMVIDGATGSPP